MENDNSKTLTASTDILEEDSLELDIWWQQYREWEQGERGEFPSNGAARDNPPTEDHTDCLKITNVSTPSDDRLDTLFLINLNEFIRDADGNIRFLV